MNSLIYPEVSNASEDGGTQAHYCITQERAIVKEYWEKDRGSGGLHFERVFRSTSIGTPENALLEHGIRVAVIIDLCAHKEN